jgi:hypothetical protein
MIESLVIGLHLLSHHFPDKDYQENFNPGIYVRAENGLTGGIYRNTLGRTSVYAGWTFGDRVALTIGGVTGYQLKDGFGMSNAYITPMIAPSVRLGPARFSVIPRVGNSAAVLHLSVERKF